MTKTLFTNCTIYNVPDADSILCHNGMIEKIGSNLSENGINVVDLDQGFVYPGFVDAHLHLAGFGWSLDVPNLVNTSSVDEILGKLSELKSDHSNHQWIHGRGWDQNHWENPSFPTKEMLDSVIEDTPVYLRRVDGHAAWVNSKALKIANITSSSKDPDGGKILRHPDGSPSGILIDNAMELAAPHIPKPTREDKKRYIRLAVSELIANGITGVHDAGTDNETIRILKDLIKKQPLPLRVYAMLNDTPEDTESFFSAGPETSDPFLKIQAVKLYMDGALGSRGAAMLEPYSDDPSNSGSLLMDEKTLSEKIHRANTAGFQVCIHCIGDRANRFALNAFEQCGKRQLRNRVEHAQLLHQDDIQRFSHLDVLPSMQPTHCTADMNWVEERMGSKRLNECYPWQSLIRAGSIIPGGSDAPVEYPSPLEGIYAAVTRQDKKGNPKSGWQSSETVNIDQAIAMMTSWAAYASFEEQIKGKIKPGYYADLTVLDKPLEFIPAKEILSTKILHTVVNGKIVYSLDS